jgi:hypothetical protein
MNSKDVKAFIFQRLGLRVSVRTIPCKARWIEASIRGYVDPVTRNYRFVQIFPEAFRRVCLKTVYPNSPVGDQPSGGNIDLHRIAMLPHEWDAAVNLLLNPAPPPSFVSPGQRQRFAK